MDLLSNLGDFKNKEIKKLEREIYNDRRKA